MAVIISNMVGTSVNQFIDGAMAVVIIMIVWYCIKFFLVSPPTKEERAAKRAEEEERAKKFWGKVKEKGKESNIKQEKEKKKNKISPAKAHIVKAQEASEYAMESIRRAAKPADVKKINGGIEDFEHHLHKSWKYLKLLRRDATDNKDREDIHKVMVLIEGIKERITSELKGKIPDFDTSWVANIKPKLKELSDLRGSVHAVWNEMMKYHE